MRIAILADIHGNLAAFEAALEHVARQGVDQIVIAGDVVNGATDSAACLELALSLGCPIIQGNHERYVYDFGTERAPEVWSTERFLPLRWTVEQLSQAQRDVLRGWPRSYRPPGVDDLLIVHASLRSDADLMRPYMPEAELGALFPGVEHGAIVRGHYHLPEVRMWGERLIVTSSSIGMPLDGHTLAQYVIMERRREGWRPQHYALPYDLDLTLRRMRQSGFLEAAAPMAELYLREVATASYYLVPFLHAYQRWSAAEPLALDAGVERFLRYGPI
jgi:hypothetical protein